MEIDRAADAADEVAGQVGSEFRMRHSTARRIYVANGVDAAAADVAGLDSERGTPVPLAGYRCERRVPAVRLRPASVSSGSGV
jgi:hypothetical protein